MEFEIKGQKYRAAKLNVFEQLKVSRKLLPLLSGLLGEIKVLRQLKTGQISIEDALKVALPVIAQTLADVSDDDSNAIIHPCPGGGVTPEWHRLHVDLYQRSTDVR